MTKIIDLLCAGSENAICLEELSKRTSISTFVLKKLIQQERNDGSLILSSKQGYYLPKNDSEVVDFVRMMEIQAKSRFIHTRSARAFLKLSNIEKQKALDRGKIETPARE